MKMFDYCKCTLPNEIYLLSLNVCIQLLKLNVMNNFQLMKNTIDDSNKTKNVYFYWSSLLSVGF